jgi:hypothetical protein
MHAWLKEGVMNFNLPSLPKTINTDTIVKLSTFTLSFAAFGISLYTVYRTYFYEAESVFVQENGISVPKRASGDTLEAALNRDAQFTLINAGSRPLAIENIYLAVFQPGKQRGERDDRADFLTAPQETANQEFNGSDCQGDVTVVPFLLPPLLEAGKIAIAPISLAPNPNPNATEITLNDANRSSGEPQFVVCLSLRIRDIHGKKYTANIPQWSTTFKLNHGNLVDKSFAATVIRDADLFLDSKLLRKISH